MLRWLICIFGIVVKNSLVENAAFSLGLFINQIICICHFRKSIISSRKTKKTPHTFSIRQFTWREILLCLTFYRIILPFSPKRKFTYHRISFHRFHRHSHPPCHTAMMSEYSVHSHKKIGPPDTSLLSRQNTLKMQGKWTRSVRCLGACLYVEAANLEGISWPAAHFTWSD